MSTPDASFVLVSRDSTFIALFREAVARDARLVCRAIAAPETAAATVRAEAPRHVLLDIDGQSPAALAALCRTLTLVRPVQIVLLGAAAGPASPAAAAVLAIVDAAFVAKPATVAGLALVEASTADAFCAALLRRLQPEAA